MRHNAEIMRISIIIPVYNVEPFIADCVQSVMRQTFSGQLDCIVVDDCGTDKSIEVVEKLIAGYEGPIEFKVLHHEHNRGLSAARNTGMEAARGDYVYFLDSDDWISDDCIEKLVGPLQQKTYDIVVGDYETVGELPYHLELSLPEGSYHELGITHTFCDGGVYVMAVNKLYRKEYMHKNRLVFEEGRIHEDEILAFELSCIEKTFYVVKAVTYYYRIRRGSIVTNHDCFNSLKARIGILQAVKEKVKKFECVDGIYDFYLYSLKRVYGSVSWIDMDKEMLLYINKHTKGYLDVIPGIRCLKSKHNRLVYYACKRDQTYSRYEYVTKEYADTMQGRIIRNILNLLPDKNCWRNCRDDV